MTEFRGIFERFQNLNLIVLREDLRRGLVARKVWIQDSLVVGNTKLCPLAHGWSGCFREVGSCEARIRTDKLFGFNSLAFTTPWDDRKLSDAELVAVIDSIFAERLADADAVQAVLGQPEEVLA